MTILNAHYDGKQIVLDEPMPPDVPENCPVQVVVGRKEEPCALDALIANAIDAGLPNDYSTQHEHYVKGAPRR